MLAAALVAAPLENQSELVYRIALIVLALVLAASVVTDLRSRLIYNWVTLPGLCIELALVGLAAGFDGLKSAAIGILVCAAPLALASIRGAVGMGDVKLIAVVGAVAGWPLSLMVLLYIAIAGGVQAIGQWIYAAVRGREKPKYVPYGVAIAAGTLATWLLGR